LWEHPHEVFDLLDAALVHHLLVEQENADAAPAPMRFREREVSQDGRVLAAADRDDDVLEVVEDEGNAFARRLEDGLTRVALRRHRGSYRSTARSGRNTTRQLSGRRR